MSKYRITLTQSGPSYETIPVPFCTLVGLQAPDTH